MKKRAFRAVLIAELREEDTIVIVPHSIQQADSDETAFLFEGGSDRIRPTRQIFHKPAKRETENDITGRIG